MERKRCIPIPAEGSELESWVEQADEDTHTVPCSALKLRGSQ